MYLENSFPRFSEVASAMTGGGTFPGRRKEISSEKEDFVHRRRRKGLALTSSGEKGDLYWDAVFIGGTSLNFACRFDQTSPLK